MAEDKKAQAPGTEQVDRHITLKVDGTDGSIVYFKINRNTQLKKLMMAYCERQGTTLDRLRFVYSGSRLSGDLTPKDYEMEEDDTIEVYHAIFGPSFFDVVIPPTQAATTFITLKVVGPDDDATMIIKMKHTTKMKKLMKAFCSQRGLPEGSLKFLFDGLSIREDSTPMELKMEDDDAIEVFHYQY